MIDSRLRKRMSDNRDQEIVLQGLRDPHHGISVLEALTVRLSEIERMHGGEEMEYIYDIQGPAIGADGPSLSFSISPELDEDALVGILEWIESELLDAGDSEAHITTT